MEVNFCDKNVTNDSGFSLELSQRMNYGEVGSREYIMVVGRGYTVWWSLVIIQTQPSALG